MLSDLEIQRYHRQINLKGFDFEGQEALKTAHVIIIGVGGLGCTVAQYLTAAGIGELTLVDFDTVSLSNLQRQILHNDARLGQPKVESAKTALLQIRQDVVLNCYNASLDDEAVQQQLHNANIVIDCTDNVQTRNLLNQRCYQAKKALISGAAVRMEGFISVFTYQDNEPCYACLSHLFGDTALTCVENGVMAPLVGVIGTLQALECIKYLTQYGQLLTHRLLFVDAMTMQFREMRLSVNPHCSVCHPE